MMKTILTILTAVAVVLGAPQQPDAPSPVVPLEYRQGPLLAEDKVGSSVEKRSAIDIDEGQMRITDTLEQEIKGLLSQI